MDWLNDNILTLVVFAPLAGVLLLMATPKESHGLHRAITLGTTLLAFGISLHLPWHWNGADTGFQYDVRYDWISSIGADYALGIDGFSLWLILLTTFLMPIVVAGAFKAVEKRIKGFHIHLLLLETGMLGAFASLDMVLFYVFWEAMLIPMYFLIGVWGGPRRIYATLKFFIYTMAGSLLMLVAIVGLGWLHFNQTGHWSFNYEDFFKLSINPLASKFMFGAFALAFAIKVPLFPFHTWLPDAHVEAPTAGSVILAGVLLKMGTYGLARFAMPLFPDALAYFTPALAVLSVIGIVYGALVAMVQPDIKKLVAYSSVSHLGFVVLGLVALNPQGIQGAFLQMIGHGLSTGALFMLVGMIYERRHTRLISEYGGLAKVMPVYTALFLVVTLASIGLPGLNGFVAEFLILIGSFRSFPLLTVLATTGVILGAVYMLSMFQRVFFGTVSVKANLGLKDMSLREAVLILLLIIPMFGIGLYPKFLTQSMEPAVTRLIQHAVHDTPTVAEHGRSSGGH